MQLLALWKRITNVSRLLRDRLAQASSRRQHAVEFVPSMSLFISLMCSRPVGVKNRLFSIERDRNEKRTDWVRVKECKGKHGVAKIFAKASWRAARKPALLFWEAGRRSKSSGADYGLRVHKRTCMCTHKHTSANMKVHTNMTCMYCLNRYPHLLTHTYRLSHICAVISDVPQGGRAL